ncbi:MAG: aspartate kinase, partial [Thermoleophilia bacterium]|nr:aspartate kinase [Thermoleophilia bacterium]
MMSFTVPQSSYEAALAACRPFCQEIGAAPPTGRPKVAKLSILGTGLKSHIDVASRTFKTLAQSQINVEMISTSEVRLNVVTTGDKGRQALTVLRQEFAEELIDL